MKQKSAFCRVMAMMVLFLSMLGMTQASWAADNKTLERMERLIMQQQEQIKSQAEAIEALKKQVEALSEAQKKAATKPTVAAVQPGPLVKSGNDKVSVKLYGQLNRGALYADDGDKGRWSFVDNDNSSTRIGLIGTANPMGEVSLGTRFEVEFQSNPSNEVSQLDDNGVGDNNFKQRHFDIFLDSQRFGKLSIGQGCTASDGTAEVDLSGTDVVGYSSIVDMAGGFYFWDKTSNGLSNTQIGNVFTNMDGLGRDDRLRYDSPKFKGFAASASVVSGNAADLALRYSAEIGETKVAAAAAYSDPAGNSTTVDSTTDGSVSFLHSSGFNGTLALGSQDKKISGQDDGSFFYAKLGYRHGFFSIGETALALDYALNEDIAQNGDEADSIGLHAVQYIDSWATEYYLGFRYHNLDRNNADYDSINAVLTGFRVKF
jgi:hypothetical protein